MQGVQLRKYGVEYTVDFELYEIDGVDLRTDWVPAQVDCEIMKDGGTSTTCTNTATDEGSTYSIVITATEAQAARNVIKIVDAATKVFLDKVIVVETYGNASAQHAFDLDTASVAQGADNNTILSSLTIANGAVESDLVQMGGVVQSATDLKDFADAGYDPGTNKVQGVVLVDTTTTVTGGATSSAQTTAQNDLNVITGSDGATLATAQGNYAPSKAGDAMDLISDALDANALASDAIDEIWAKAMVDLAQGAPSATASVLVAINYLYEAWRNKTETTSSLITVMKDDGTTGLVKSSIADAAGTFTKDEFITGV